MAKAEKAVEVTSVTVELKENESILIINSETRKMLDLAFSVQSDVENQTKFERGFAFDAVKSRLAYTANSAVATWEREVGKQQKLHPTQTREQVIADMLEGRKAQELKNLAEIGEQVKVSLK